MLDKMGIDKQVAIFKGEPKTKRGPHKNPTPPKLENCLRCGRPLRKPVWEFHGMGPVCLKILKQPVYLNDWEELKAAGVDIQPSKKEVEQLERLAQSEYLKMKDRVVADDEVVCIKDVDYMDVPGLRHWHKRTWKDNRPVSLNPVNFIDK